MGGRVFPVAYVKSEKAWSVNLFNSMAADRLKNIDSMRPFVVEGYRAANIRVKYNNMLIY
jgi:hypothetical protein